MEFTHKERDGSPIIHPDWQIEQENNKIYFTGDIEPISAIDLAERIDRLMLQPVIKIYVASLGGQGIALAMVREVIARSLAQVRTYTACAASAGVTLWMMGDVRKIRAGTELILHGQICYHPDGSVMRDATALARNIAHDRVLAEFFAKQCGGKTSAAQFMEIFSRSDDTIVTAEQALAMGMAHKVT